MKLKTIQIYNLKDIPSNFTGIASNGSTSKYWVKNGALHNANGPSAIDCFNKSKYWHLNGVLIWNSGRPKFYLKELSYLSNKRHPKFRTVHVLSYLNANGIKEQIIIPGMEPWFPE